ncbi:MAG: hypothetical protein R2820_06490 [Cyclobacteriaceae bacterium]|nr:hypothetical protein [Cyclobacteriaceae bacterium]
MKNKSKGKKKLNVISRLLRSGVVMDNPTDKKRKEVTKHLKEDIKDIQKARKEIEDDH